MHNIYLTAFSLHAIAIAVVAVSLDSLLMMALNIAQLSIVLIDNLTNRKG